LSERFLFYFLFLNRIPLDISQFFIHDTFCYKNYGLKDIERYKVQTLSVHYEKHFIAYLNNQNYTKVIWWEQICIRYFYTRYS